ncbi:hypothetical protein LguiB_002781 [Lonicera macranthoides]
MLKMLLNVHFVYAEARSWNIFAFGLFVSPIPTFRRILRNQSTEQFSGLPYIYALLNCLICAWYGTPLISSDNVLVTTVNSAGAIFQLAYIILFITFAEREKKIRMCGLLLAVFGFFAIMVAGSLHINDISIRHTLIGLLSTASLVSMFASPLFIIVSFSLYGPFGLGCNNSDLGSKWDRNHSGNSTTSVVLLLREYDCRRLQRTLDSFVLIDRYKNLEYKLGAENGAICRSAAVINS